MFYPKNLMTKSSTTRQLKIAFSPNVSTLIDDTSLPQNVAKISYNTDCSSGSLKNGAGVKEFLLYDADTQQNVAIEVNGVEFVNGWYFTKRTSGADDHRIVLLGNDGYLYQISVNSPSDGIEKITGITFDLSAQAVNYRLEAEDVLLISSATDYLAVFDGETSPYELTDAPKAVSMETHYERLFATCGDTVLWFSDDLDPTNWNISLDQAGYIEFADVRGKLKKLVSFDDYLYIFRQYGITRLSAYAEQEDFSVTQLYTSGGSIYPDTVKACGNRIIFFSDDGLYSFDGLSANRIIGEINNLFKGVDNTASCAGYANGKYYLSCRLDYGADGIKDSVIRYDTVTGEYSICCGVSVNAFCETYVNGKADIILFCGAKIGQFCENGKLFGENFPKNHICPQTDLGYAGRTKELLFLYVYTQSDITVKLCLDGKWNYYSVSGADEYQRIAVRLPCQTAQVCISTDCETLFVRPCYLVYKTY